jgi:hypothetical protein
MRQYRSTRLPSVSCRRILHATRCATDPRSGNQVTIPSAYGHTARVHVPADRADKCKRVRHRSEIPGPSLPFKKPSTLTPGRLRVTFQSWKSGPYVWTVAYRGERGEPDCKDDDVPQKATSEAEPLRRRRSRWSGEWPNRLLPLLPPLLCVRVGI